MPAEDEHRLDIVSSAEGDCEPTEQQPPSSGRPWIGVRFECCGVYRRIYRTPDAARYEGHCPKCARRVTVGIGPEGVAERIFRAVPV
jgi:hypothetical protein